MNPLTRGSSVVLAMALALLAVLAATLVDGSDRSAVLGALVLGVVVLGLPHGAADPWVAAAACRPSPAGRGRLAFFAGYIGLGLLVVAGWSLWPVVSLIGFLLVSLLHFGLADTRERSTFDSDRVAAVLQRGMLPIALPIGLHPTEVAVIFGELVGADAQVFQRPVEITGTLALGIFTVLSGWLVLRISVQRGPRAGLLELVESGGLATLFLVLPLLPAFALYFGGWHSARHLLLLRGTLRRSTVSTRTIAIGGLAIWIAAVAFLVAAPELLAALSPDRSTSSVETLAGIELLPAIFVGLAGLTVPHVVLPDLVAGSCGLWSPAGSA